MAKTNFSDTPPLGTIVTALFLNALQNHRHTGIDADGSCPIDYAVDTGAANVYAITLTPALAAHVIGLPITFKAVHANTGASTFNPGSGAIAIKKNVGTALAAGDIAAGQIVTVVYDGTYYQLINNGQAVDYSLFSGLIDSPGYIKIPVIDSGVKKTLIIQWMRGNCNSSGILSLTNPIAFPTEPLAGIANEAVPGGWSPTQTTEWGFHKTASNAAISVAWVRNIDGTAGPVIATPITGLILVWGY